MTQWSDEKKHQRAERARQNARNGRRPTAAGAARSKSKLNGLT
jgi:hypothetical protein